MKKNIILPRRRVLRSFAWLLLVLLLQVTIKVSAAAYREVTVTLQFKAAPLRVVLLEIKKQTGYGIVYTEKLLRDTKPVTVSVENQPLDAALSLCFEGQPVTWKIVEKSIIVTRTTNSGSAQPVPRKDTGSVNGRVIDQWTGEGIPGVTILVQGTSNGTVSNEDGVFNIANILPGFTILKVQSIGYESKTIVVRGDRSIDIQLSRHSNELNETIIMAYGATTRKLNTGSIAKVSAKTIETQPVSNPLAALQGRVPGLIVTQTTGLAGGAFKVELRGRTAIDRGISDDQPLFVIDGVPYGPNNGYLSTQTSAIGSPTTSAGATSPGGISPLGMINPQDIESIEILKDADATAIYGSRGANGVILITTKKAVAGRLKLTINANAGSSEAIKTVKMMDTRTYIQMRRTAYMNSGRQPTATNGYDLLKWDTTRYTNFPELFSSNPATNQDVQLSVSGGSPQTQFLISGSFNRQTSVLAKDLALKRGTAHIQINHRSQNKKLNFNLSILTSADQNNLLSGDPAAFYFLPPNMAVYNENGGLAWNEGGVSSTNPLAQFKRSYDAKNKSLAGNLNLSYELAKGLTARVTGGYNYNFLKETSLSPIAAVNPNVSLKTGSSILSKNEIGSWTVEPQMEYKSALSRGMLTALLGATLQATDQASETINAQGFTNDDFLTSLGAATSLSATSDGGQYRYKAIFARLNYNFDDRYIINLTARRDGSSRFAPENRFANFAAIGGAWIFTNENFLRSRKILSFGKIRGSYGTTGNDKISNYQYLDTWTFNYSTYNGGQALYPDKLYNPTYQWERTTKSEVALELGFAEDRVMASAAWYSNSSANQLVRYPLPISTGFSNVIDNLPARIRNNGWEFTLSSRQIQNRDLFWSTSFNITIPRSKLVSYPGLENSSYADQFVIGQPLSVIYKYKYIGVDEQTGIYKVEDVDKNDLIDSRDLQPLGYTEPKIYGGISNTLTYKGLTLDFFVSFTSQTSTTYLPSLRSMPGTMNNLPAAMKDFWEKPGDKARYQQVATAGSVPFVGWIQFQNSDGAYSNGSYARLKNASLSYSLPRIWLRQIGMSSTKIYVQGQNLLTLTKYEVTDPETININRTSPMRTVVAGIQMVF